jgi:hypothetical protein
MAMKWNGHNIDELKYLIRGANSGLKSGYGRAFIPEPVNAGEWVVVISKDDHLVLDEVDFNNMFTFVKDIFE